MNEKITPTTADTLLRGGGYTINQGQQFAFPQARDPLRPKKVAIMGTQPSSRMMAPFDNPEWTIWGSSPGNMEQLPRVDAWFELHCNLLWTEFSGYGRPYLRWLREQRFPVVMWDHRYLPNAIVYPRREMVKRFGGYFFSSTFAWMMAYAIYAGVEEMGLYGVDMSSKDEYIQQRPGGHYFIQMARMAGINVVVPPESDLLQTPPLYGWSDASPYSRKMKSRETEIRSQLGPLEQQINQGQQQAVYLRGALENINYMQQVWGGAADETEEPISPDMEPIMPMPPDGSVSLSTYMPQSFQQNYTVPTPIVPLSSAALPGSSMIVSPPIVPTMPRRRGRKPKPKPIATEATNSGDNDERIIPDHL